MKKYIYCLLFLTTFYACNKGIPKEKLTVIENITLGRPSNSYNKHFDSLQIPHRRFFNKLLFMEYDDLLNDNIFYSTYYTNIFNFNEYKNKGNSLDHLGLITPVTLEGTQNNFALIIVLCHTVEPWLWGNAKQFKSSFDEKYVRQDVNEEIISKVKKLYIEKYGDPTTTNTSSFNTFWMINGSSLKRSTDNTYEATTIKWETDYYTVTFFTGFDLKAIYSPENGYSESTDPIVANLDEKSIDPLKNEIHCRSFAYIYYELNEKAMKELKTNNKKL
jgi:hypothetical protein